MAEEDNMGRTGSTGDFDVPVGQVSPDTANREKSRVALNSVATGLSITVLKIVVGISTGSLGILAEAAHSGLDLVAALMTLIAVRVSGKPPDATHSYGHGKFENLSAFLEAGLLLAVAGWVAFEAIHRLVVLNVHVDASGWAFAVMGLSIILDVGRSRALQHAARKYHSDALQADGLHFSTDIWSSAAVLIGLAAVRIGDATGWPGPWEQADALGALAVCGIVAFVGGRLLRDTAGTLVDQTPGDVAGRIARAVQSVEGVTLVGSPRVRRVGGKVFADVVVHIARTSTFNEAHRLTELVEQATRAALPDASVDLVLHMEPAKDPNEDLAETVRFRARELGLRVHDVRIVQTAATHLEADLHLEADATQTLDKVHLLVDQLEAKVRRDVPSLAAIHAHLELLNPPVERRLDVTATQRDLVYRIGAITERVTGGEGLRSVKVYQPVPAGRLDTARAASPASGVLDVTVQITARGDAALAEVHLEEEQVEQALRQEIPGLAHVLVEAIPDTTGSAARSGPT